MSNRTRDPDPVTVADLPTRAGSTFLYCVSCDARWSATRGDYSFRLPSDHRFTCHQCGAPLCLAHAETSIILHGEE